MNSVSWQSGVNLWQAAGAGHSAPGQLSVILVWVTAATVGLEGTVLGSH